MRINLYSLRSVFLCIFGVISVIIISCTGKQSAFKSSNVAAKKEEMLLHPSFVVHHVTKDSSDLWFSIPAGELLYSRYNQKDYQAKGLIRYYIENGPDVLQFADSGSFKFSDTYSQNKEQLIIGKIRLKLKNGISCFQISLTDINRNISTKQFLFCEKSENKGRYNFLLCDTQYNKPLFRNYLLNDESASLMCPVDSPGSKIFVRYYNRQFPLPPPAFSSAQSKPFLYKADSTFVLQTSPTGELLLNLKAQGFYHFQTDTAIRDGFTVFRHSKNFPFVTEATEMAQSIRFLTTRQEYEDIWNSPDLKIAVEDLWLKSAGSEDRARQTMAAYYQRVQFANAQFTSYVEGWKTDRGLILIIFGYPNSIYKEALSEIWVYGEESSYKALTFTFVKVLNPFTDNDYSLNRSDLYKDEWNRSVDTWRQGRIYNDR